MASYCPANNTYTGGIWVHQNAQGNYTIAGRFNNQYALITINASTHSHSTVTWGAGQIMIILMMQISCLMEGISSLAKVFNTGDYGDLYYVRTDSQGNICWEKTLGGAGTGGEYGESVATLNDGSIVILYYDQDSALRKKKGIIFLK
jgi:hypothetical protein